MLAQADLTSMAPYLAGPGAAVLVLMAVLVGLYNLAPELRRRFADQPHVHFLYDGYQLHLSSVRDGLGATCVNLAGVEDYSCEFNASKDFDRLFAGKVPVVVNASPHRK